MENQLEGLRSSSPPPPPPLSSRLPSLDVGVALSDPSGGAAERREAQGSEADPSRVAAPDRDSGEGIASDVTAFHGEVDIFDDARGDVSLREAEEAPSGPAVLSGELRDQIVRQVEYYFSDGNLPTDSFLQTFIKKDKEGYVPIKVISSFRRMKKLTQELSLIEAALRTSSQLVVSEDGRKVKRLHSLSLEIADTKLRTVIVENLPDDCSEANIRRIFGKFGKIVKVTVHNPHLMEKLANKSKSRIILSSKIHALVEYGTIEAAESAINSLNDEKNWRSGMRVELLAKRMEKHWLMPKGRKVTVTENNSSLVEEPTADGEKISIDSHNEVAMKEEGERGKGIRRTKYKSQGRGQAQQNSNRHGGSASGVELANNHVQGPRMPDGTKGFAFGRGKPTS
ncbi:la-related protein 6A isoform X1 [Curcuma longa]|uniref:la-related protein 6A isoform X1 n=1 Tax=Curcuma longa TaxID=136217 RepID=UPI003D9DE404